ncbi:unnamed protein product, partial [Closterium sp. Naga37s-1]
LTAALPWAALATRFCSAMQFLNPPITRCGATAAPSFCSPSSPPTPLFYFPTLSYATFTLSYSLLQSKASPSLFPPVAFPFPSRRLPFSLSSPSLFPLVASPFPSRRPPFSLPSPSLFPPVAFPFLSRRLPFSLPSPTLFPRVAFPFPSRSLPFPLPSPSPPSLALMPPAPMLPFIPLPPSLFHPLLPPFSPPSPAVAGQTLLPPPSSLATSLAILTHLDLSHSAGATLPPPPHLTTLHRTPLLPALTPRPAASSGYKQQDPSDTSTSTLLLSLTPCVTPRPLPSPH